MLKNQKGLSAVVIIIIVAVIIAVLVVVTLMATPSVEEPIGPADTEEPTELEGPVILENLIPIEQMPPGWLETFPWLAEEYPEGVPLEVLIELEEEFLEIQEMM